MVRKKSELLGETEQAKHDFRSFANKHPQEKLSLGALLKKVVNNKYFPSILPFVLILVGATWNAIFNSGMEEQEKGFTALEEKEAPEYKQLDPQLPQEMAKQTSLPSEMEYPEQQTGFSEAANSIEPLVANSSIKGKKRVCQFKSDQGPEMQVIGGGVFLMGSKAGEQRYANESPQHIVTVQPFAMSRCEVSVAEFALFVEATGYVTAAENGSACYGRNPSNGQWENFASWRNPGFSQTDASPVVCLNKQDVLEYINWLGQRLGSDYRVPSESEWEYAARVGNDAQFPFPIAEICRYANVAHEDNCPDEFDYTAPVGSFLPNAFGLYDMHGNVFEWVADCWHNDYTGAPVDGSSWGEENGGDCQQGTIRGGGWQLQSGEASAVNRGWCQSDSCSFVGFRVAKTL